MKPNKYSKKSIALALAMILCAGATFTVAAKDSPEEVNISSEKKESDMSREAEDKTPEETNVLASNAETEDGGLTEENVSPEKEELDTSCEAEGKTSEETNAAASNVATENRTTVNGQAAKLAEGYIGTPYLFGGEDLSSGVDCSGFVKAIFAQVGIELPRTIDGLADCGIEIPLYFLEAGDILIYGEQKEDQQAQFSHAGIYDGQGKVIHASNDKDGVKSSDYDYRPICKAIRILE